MHVGTNTDAANKTTERNMTVGSNATRTSRARGGVGQPGITSLEDARRSSLAALTVAEAAHLMRVDPRTLRAAAAAGDIPSVRVGARVLIPREKFLALVDAGTSGERI